MNTRREIGQHLAEQLEALDERLTRGEYVCGCDPLELVIVRGTPWAYSRQHGWHDASVGHSVYWPSPDAHDGEEPF